VEGGGDPHVKEKDKRGGLGYDSGGTIKKTPIKEGSAEKESAMFDPFGKSSEGEKPEKTPRLQNAPPDETREVRETSTGTSGTSPPRSRGVLRDSLG